MELLLSNLSDFRQDQNGVNVLNTWSILIPPKSSEVYERHSCSIDLFLLLSHFHFTCQTVLCSIVCNMFVNRAYLFLYVICVMSVLKALQSLCCMLLHVLTLNKTFLTLSLLTDSHGPPFVSFFIIHPQPRYSFIEIFSKINKKSQH